MERENDAIVNALSEDMEKLRRATSTLRDEVADHNKLLDQLEVKFGGATRGLKNTIGKLDTVMQKYGMKHSVMIALGLFVGALLLYWFFRSGKSSSS